MANLNNTTYNYEEILLKDTDINKEVVYALQKAGISSMAQVIEYCDSGKLLHDIDGVEIFDEIPIIEVAKCFDIDPLYKSLTCEEYVEIFHVGVYNQYKEYRNACVAAVLPTMEIEIKSLGFETRINNALSRWGLKTIGDIITFLYLGDRLSRIRNIGAGSIEEINARLKEYMPDCDYEDMPAEYREYIRGRVCSSNIDQLCVQPSTKMYLSRQGFERVGDIVRFVNRGNNLREMMIHKSKTISEMDYNIVVEVLNRIGINVKEGIA